MNVEYIHEKKCIEFIQNSKVLIWIINNYRFSRENFSAKVSYDFSRFVTKRHNLFSNRVAPLKQGCRLFPYLEQSVFSCRNRSIIKLVQDTNRQVFKVTAAIAQVQG